MISKEVKRELYENVVKQTVIYDSETWSLSTQERRKIEIFEMTCLRNICGIGRADRLRNSLITERYGCELSVLEIKERKVLKWFRHVERMGKERLVKSEFEGNRGRRRP